MVLFRYNNYTGDLTTKPDWSPHDPWDQHYSQPGFDDRDQQLEGYLDGITASPIVKTWTGPVTAVTTNPNLGSTGSSAGRYTLDRGRCNFEMIVQWLGAGQTAGVGDYRVAMPVPANSSIASSFQTIGTGWFFNALFHNLTIDMSPGAPLMRFVDGTTGLPLTAASWGAGAVWSFNGSYRT